MNEFGGQFLPRSGFTRNENIAGARRNPMQIGLDFLNLLARAKNSITAPFGSTRLDDRIERPGQLRGSQWKSQRILSTKIKVKTRP
jgi:hypothetical protein